MPTLHFKGKTAVENYHHTVPHHRLEFDAKLSVLGKGEKPNLEGNLIIEGDNLLALKALLPTHAGRVKCIYIDPPYNTGNEGWVYNDKLNQPQFKEWIGRTVGKEGEDACRHDKWCCMMYPRLSLLRELLREDGSIWISIDDNEVHNLRSLMDEIFGKENFIASVIWEKVYSPKSSAKYLSENHDYIVAYAKTKSVWNRRLLPRTEEANARYENPDDDPRGPWKPSDLSARNYYSKGKYAIECPSGRMIDGPPEGRYWTVSEETLEELDNDNRIWWGRDGDGMPALKRFLSEVKDIVPETIWTYREVGHTQDAKKEVIRILGGTESPVTPKPVALIERILWIASEPGDIILDSFAGTGTTGHAAIVSAHENGTPRRFILVQQEFDNKDDENSKYNICEKLTSERVRRAMSGYSYTRRAAKGKTSKQRVEGLGGTFSYARVGDVLFSEYKDFGKALPAYEDVAKYVFYTETSHEFPGATKKQNPAWDKKVGRIGAHGGRSYYLLYEPNEKVDRGLDRPFLRDVASKDPNRELVVYCEMLSVHADELRRFSREHGKRIRHMLVPFNLK